MNLSRALSKPVAAGSSLCASCRLDLESRGVSLPAPPVVAATPWDALDATTARSSDSLGLGGALFPPPPPLSAAADSGARASASSTAARADAVRAHAASAAQRAIDAHNGQGSDAGNAGAAKVETQHQQPAQQQSQASQQQQQQQKQQQQQHQQQNQQHEQQQQQQHPPPQQEQQMRSSTSAGQPHSSALHMERSTGVSSTTSAVPQLPPQPLSLSASSQGGGNSVVTAQRVQFEASQPAAGGSNAPGLVNQAQFSASVPGGLSLNSTTYVSSQLGNVAKPVAVTQGSASVSNSGHSANDCCCTRSGR